MRKSLLVLAIVGLLVGVLAAPASARGKGNPHGQPVVFVTSQGLYYDSVVLTPIPFVEGTPYQLLVDNMGQLETEFGLGDIGYVGGRWWMDDGDGVMEADDDLFFMCPLLGLGRSAP